MSCSNSVATLSPTRSAVAARPAMGLDSEAGPRLRPEGQNYEVGTKREDGPLGIARKESQRRRSPLWIVIAPALRDPCGRTKSAPARHRA